MLFRQCSFHHCDHHRKWEESTLMSQLNRDPNTDPNTWNKGEVAPDQPVHAMYSYCKVKRDPRLVPVAVVVTVLEGVLITLLVLAAGVSLLRAVFIGGFFSALFAFIFWYAKRVQTGAVQRLDAYLAADGVCTATLPRHSPLRTTSSGLADSICLSKTVLCSGLTALPIS